MYTEWADGQVTKMKGILNAAREDHTSAVKSRIENVKQLGSVIDVTKQLFEVSKVWRCTLCDNEKGATHA
jgi:F-type H+-transporting ATPase subunit b